MRTKKKIRDIEEFIHHKVKENPTNNKSKAKTNHLI